MKGGPINPKQIISCDKTVKFKYKDHRDQRIKILALKTEEFMRRILWHVPEIGVHVVRHYGLYASNNRKKRNVCREIVGGIEETESSTGNENKTALNWCCKICGEQLKRVFSTYKSANYENSLIERAYSAHVQQYVKVDLTSVLRIRGVCNI